MKKIVFAFLLISLGVNAQVDTLTPEGKARYKVNVMRGVKIPLLSPRSLTDAMTAMTDLAVMRTPFLTMEQLRLGRADTASVVNVLNNGKVWTFQYDASSTALDDSNTVIRHGNRRYVIDVPFITPQIYGAKGDSVTDDTQALQRMLSKISSNTTIDFGRGNYNFTSINIKEKNNVKFQGNGAVFKGTVIVGDTNSSASIYDMDFSADGIRFEHTGTNRNCYEVANMRGFVISNTHVVGGKAIFYVRPLNKFQHVNRGSVKNSHGNSDYLIYADNAINTPPYTGIQMTLGDIEISGNSHHEAKIGNILAFGVDGMKIMANVFFMTGYPAKSQVKNQNIRIIAGNWVSIVNNQLFEAGLEGVLLEKNRNFTISSNRVGWYGQRDVNFGYGIRVTGGGYTDVNYTTGTITDNLFDRGTRSDIRLDAGCTGITVATNRGTATGSSSFYYGDGTKPVADPTATPLINSVPHYAVEADVNTKRCAVYDHWNDSVDYLFPFSETSGISNPEQLKHRNNNSNFSGSYEERSRTVTTIASDGKVDTKGSNNIIFQVTATAVIKDVLDAKIGDIIHFYNDASANLSIENNSSIQLATNATSLIPIRTTISLQKRNDKWYEISRSNNGVVVTPANLYINGAAGVNKDFGFQTNNNFRWFVRSNSTAESGSNAGSDLEFVPRTDAGGFLGYAGRIYRSTLNWSIGDIAADSPTAKLAIHSTDKGFLPPRLNNSQRDAIVTPAEGLEVYSTNDKKPSFFDGTIWRKGILEPEINTTSTSYTKSTLNALYPNAKKGTIVIQDLANKIFIRKDDIFNGDWTLITTSGQLP